MYYGNVYYGSVWNKLITHIINAIKNKKKNNLYNII